MRAVLPEAVEVDEAIKNMSKNTKTVFVSGNFNVLHPGHLRLLRFAKECGEKLIVGIFSDRISGDGSYVQEEMRLEGVKSNSCCLFQPKVQRLRTPAASGLGQRGRM